MKKIFAALFMVIILSTTALAGCSPKEPAEVPEPAKEETTQVEEENADEEEMADLAGLFKKGENVFKEGLYYEQTFTMADQQSKIKTWYKGDMIKTNVVAEGTEMINIIDSKTGDFITYSPIEKTGMKFNSKSEDSAFMPDTSMTDIASMDEQVDTSSYENLGKEKILGEDCVVILSKDKESSDEVKMWISEKYGIVMKMISKGVDGEEMTVEVTDLKVGDIPSSDFEVPSDIVIQEF